MSSLDHVDLELLAALADDHRATVVALADRLGLSRNTVQARMARLERAAVFQPFERAISPTALGFPIEAFMNVQLRQVDIPRITEELSAIPEVVQAHGLSGQVDLLVRVACRDARHLFDTDARVLADSLRKLALLPDDTVVYPGHGPNTTIGFEKQNNFFMSRL